MTEFPFNSGEREIQERFDCVRLADKLVEVTMRADITDSDRRFLARMDMFFLATSDAEGNLDCSYKGGDPGFVRVLDDGTVVFPSYDGNGMYMSGGNILMNANVGMLFIDWERQYRMRLNGTASIDFDDPLMAEYPEAQFVVRVRPRQIFPNCPRYIHKMQLVERSRFVPRAASETPEPEWKDYFEEALPAAQQERRATKRTPAP